MGPTYHRIFAKTIGLSLPQQNLIGTYVLVVEWDVTEWWRKREEANRMRASDRQKSELIFDLAHILKGPLDGLSKLASENDMYLSSFTSSSPSGSPGPTTFAGVVKRMTKLVEQIADYADATHWLDDTHRVKNVSTNVGEILEGVQVLFGPACMSQGVSVTVEPPLGSLPLVMSQPHKLALLFNYMFEISIKHTRSKNFIVRLSPSVEVGAVTVAFTDQSRTVTQAELEEMFNKPPAHGYLAPAIVKKVADALGVNITFTTLALGGGSSINITIPEVCLSGMQHLLTLFADTLLILDMQHL